MRSVTRRAKPPPLALVVWEDARALDPGQTWVHHKRTAYRPLLVHSTGFLLYDGPEGVVLTSAWSEDVTGPRDQIPRGMIRELKRLDDASSQIHRPADH